MFLILLLLHLASLGAQLVKNPPAMWETWVQSLGWEDPLEKGTVTQLQRILQYSGLENSRTVHGVAKSRTWLSNFHTHNIYFVKLFFNSYFLECFYHEWALNIAKDLISVDMLLIDFLILHWCGQVCHSDLWIILSWKQSKHKWLRKNLWTSLLTA